MNQNTSTGLFVLASLISSYPGPEFGSHLSTLLDDESVQVPTDLRSMLCDLANSEERTNELRSSYIEIFDHSKSLNPLYETEYGRERLMFKANELSDISAFYQAFGFELDQEAQKEMLDHISVELEFYSLLKMKLAHQNDVEDQNGIKVVGDGMQKFLKDHLGRFSSAILERPGVQANEYYTAVFLWIDALLKRECSNLNIRPEIVQWLSSGEKEDSVCCGGTVSLDK